MPDILGKKLPNPRHGTGTAAAGGLYRFFLFYFFLFSDVWSIFTCSAGDALNKKRTKKDEMILSHLDIVSINLHLSLSSHTQTCWDKIRTENIKKKTSIRLVPTSLFFHKKKLKSFPVPCLQLSDQTTRSGRGIAPGRLVLVPPPVPPCALQSSAPRFPF